MSDSTDPKPESSAEDLAEEFHQLGDNLKKFFVNAWESEQRKNLQEEIEAGLRELGDTLKDTAVEIQESETGQRIKNEAEDLRDRVRDGSVEQKVRSDLQTFLKKLNIEIEKAIPPDRNAAPQDQEGTEQE
jgi:DNA-binding transcriptional regulator GbsR (MarR family)